MADWTAADLRNKVAKRLNLVAKSENLAPEDATVIDEAWTSEHTSLQHRGLAPFGSGAIPPWAQEHLKHWLAWKVAPDFGFSGQRLAEVKAMADESMRELQAQAAANIPPVPVKAVYY